MCLYGVVEEISGKCVGQDDDFLPAYLLQAKIIRTPPSPSNTMLLATAARALTSPSTAAGSSPTSPNTSTESSPGRMADDLRTLAQHAANILDDIQRASIGDDSSEDHLTATERDELVDSRFGVNAEEDDEDDGEEGNDDDDDDDDDDNLNGNGDAVASIFRAHIVDKTRSGYQRQQKKMAVWIFKQVCNQSQRTSERNRFRAMIHQDLYTALSTESGHPTPKLDQVALPFIQRACESYHPIKLNLLTASDFVAYLLSMTPDGEFKSKSTYGGARAGLYDFFRVCKIKQSQLFEDELKQAYGGLKRKAQYFKAQTGVRLGEGKKPLPFALYKMLCGWLVTDGSKESIFAWCFITLTWNLICRSKNTVNIHKSHISWEDDAMTIQFAHSKTDMIGTEESYKRHIYANPENPIICPILALSCYLATTPTRGPPGKLFMGTSQYERFRKQLQSLVDDHAEEIRGIGIDPNDIGVHSIRKGAATYVCSGTTSAPSIAAVCNRAGWTMGKVKDTYIRYEAAMDQYVGRMVSGLDINSFRFSISSPHFLSPESIETSIQADIRTVFPFVITTEQKYMLKFCFATLLYSKSFVLERLGVESPIRSHVIYRNSSTLLTAINWIGIRYAHDEHSDVNLTGIPPHVTLFVNLEKILVRMSSLHEQMQQSLHVLGQSIITEIKTDLDAKSIGGGEVSVNRFISLLQPLQDGLTRVNERLDRATSLRAEEEEALASGDGVDERSPARWMRYEWGGKFRRLPEGWKFNRKMTVLVPWQLWHHGDESTPPLKLLDHWDLSENRVVNGKTRPIRETEVRMLYFLTYLCKELDEAAGVSGRPSIADLVQHYNSQPVQTILPAPTTQRSRVRRADELNWRYAAGVMKRRRTENNDEERE